MLPAHQTWGGAPLSWAQQTWSPGRARGVGELAQTCACRRYQGGGGGNVPHRVVFALVLISCRVVSDGQADVMDFAHKLHPTQRIPVGGDWGKQQGVLIWANSSLSVSKGKCLAKRRCISPNVLGFPEEVQRVSVINSVKRADLRH